MNNENNLKEIDKRNQMKEDGNQMKEDGIQIEKTKTSVLKKCFSLSLSKYMMKRF
jgi:hypothetical protein